MSKEAHKLRALRAKAFRRGDLDAAQRFDRQLRDLLVRDAPAPARPKHTPSGARTRTGLSVGSSYSFFSDLIGW